MPVPLTFWQLCGLGCLAAVLALLVMLRKGGD